MWEAFNAAQAAIDDNEEFARLDWDFHLTIAKAGHNVLIETFYHLCRELLLDFVIDMIKLPNVKEEASEYHKIQANAIAEHDVDAARKAAYDHMLYLKKRMGI
jgi:GntR family transcriptional repressor for pyruvate dehydrogenase complex